MADEDDKYREFLVGTVDQVQGYLTTSPRLRQIRGGSSLLVQIEADLKRMLADRKGPNGQVACAAGGIFLAMFETQGKAQEGLDLLRKTLARRAPAARFRAGTRHWERGESFKDALRSALAFEAEPDGGAAPGPLGFSPAPDVPFVLPCDVCRARPARDVITHGRREQRACDDCIARHHAGRRSSTRNGSARPTTLTRIEERLPEQVRVREDDPGSRRPLVIDDLAKGRPRGYVGYIAADGNGIGDRLEKLGDVGEYAAFSTGLDHATEVALIGGTTDGTVIRGAVDTCLAAHQSLVWSKVLPVLAGGDDLLLFTSPAIAVPLAVEFAARFEQATEADARVKGRLTTGIGVVIAHASTPFGALDRAAHQLQTNAKRLSRDHGGASAVGMCVLHSGGQVEPEKVRSGADFRAGVGCYLVKDCEKLLDAALKLKDAAPPWSRLKQIDALLRREDDEAAAIDFDLLLDAPSMKKDGVDEILRGVLDGLPSVAEPREHLWRRHGDRYVNPLPDLLALAEIL